MIKEDTLLLKQYVNHLKERFVSNESPGTFSDHNFFNQMKKETEPIFQLLEQWENNAFFYIKENPGKIYPHQIQATKENIELIILHSYYIDIRKRIFMEYYQSAVYILDGLLSDM